MFTQDIIAGRVQIMYKTGTPDNLAAQRLSSGDLTEWQGWQQATGIRPAGGQKGGGGLRASEGSK